MRLWLVNTATKGKIEATPIKSNKAIIMIKNYIDAFYALSNQEVIKDF